MGTKTNHHSGSFILSRKLREEVLGEKTFDGCLLDMIPNRLLKILSLSWDSDKTRDENLSNILSFLREDTESALNKISEKLHIRDGTADLQSLSVPIGIDAYKDPKPQEWLEKAHRALSITSSKYSTKDKNRALMAGVAESHPSIKRDFDNNFGSSWNIMDSEVLIDKISKTMKQRGTIILKLQLGKGIKIFLKMLITKIPALASPLTLTLTLPLTQTLNPTHITKN